MSLRFDSDFSGRIIQLAEAIDYGDAVSNQIIAIDCMLRNIGFDSAIYSKWCHDKMADHWNDLEQLQVGEGDILVVHFVGYSEYAIPFALSSYTTRVLVYHNITPAEFFDPHSTLYEFCEKGRRQLKEILSSFHYFWGDSRYNLDEITALGISDDCCQVIPIVVPPVSEVDHVQRESGSWLFVGRIAPNKGQLDVLELFASLHTENPESVSRLYLVGGYAVDDFYYKKISLRIDELGLHDCVILTGKVSDDERENYYRRSDIFVCMSQHEGFGVPVVEATLRGLPVIALCNAAIGETLNFGKGLASSPAQMRAMIRNLVEKPEFRRELMVEQLQNLKRFAPDTVEGNLREALRKILPKKRQYQTVSVVVCTYNRRAYLERLLDYMRYQTCSQFEIVIVDGPSDDGTKEFLAKYNGQVKIAHNPARNLSISRNIGIELATGDVVGFIDDDAIPFDDWVEVILSEYNRRPLTTVGLGGPVYYAGTLRYQVTDIGFNKFADAIADIDSSRIGKEGWARSLLGTNSTFLRCSLMYANGFDEQYDYFLDESDLCWRLQVAKGIVGYSNKLYLRHEFAESSNRKSKFNYNWYAICKNTAYFIAAFSGLEGEALLDYLRERFYRERVLPLDEAVKAGELAATERDQHIEKIWSGLDKGLADAKDFPKTRTLEPENHSFMPFFANMTRLRVGHEIKRLHVCIVSKEFPPYASRGGIGTLYYHLASELLLMGHEVTVIVPDDSYHEFIQGRFRVLYAPRKNAQLSSLDSGFANNVNWSLSAFSALADLHKMHPVDVVDSALWDTEALAISLLSRGRRPPLVVRLVTPFPVASRINGWQVPESVSSFFVEAERSLIEHADAVVPISDSIAKTIEKEHSVMRDSRWHMVPCGVAYWPSFDVNQGYGAFLGLENIPANIFDTDKLVVFFGRLEKRKGIDLVLQAANDFLASDPAVQLIIAGRDVEGWEGRTKDIIQNALISRIHFLGEVADSTRDKLLARAYCLIFPSRYESFGLVPLEAFVHGVPVVASRSGAIPEVVTDGFCGMLFDPDDYQSLAQAVTKLVTNPSLRKDLSAGATRRIHDLSSRNMAIRSLELYSSLI